MNRQNSWAMILLGVISAELGCFALSKGPGVDFQKQSGMESRSHERGKTNAEVAFAYSNRSGTFLLAPENTGRPSNRSFDRAVCSGGKTLEVKFASEQRGGPHSTSRNSAKNFDEDRGDRFAVVNGKIPGDDSCLLANHGYLEAREVLPVREHNNPCEPEIRAGIPRIENREVLTCLSLATFSGDVRLLAVEYQPEGEHLLAAFVVLAGSSAYAQPLPAKRGNSAWRVDDEGKFDASNVTALFAFRKRDGSLEVAIDWQGTEGDDLTLYGTSSLGRLEPVARGYRYTAPS